LAVNSRARCSTQASPPLEQQGERAWRESRGFPGRELTGRKKTLVKAARSMHSSCCVASEQSLMFVRHCVQPRAITSDRAGERRPTSSLALRTGTPQERSTWAESWRTRATAGELSCGRAMRPASVVAGQSLKINVACDGRDSPGPNGSAAVGCIGRQPLSGRKSTPAWSMGSGLRSGDRETRLAGGLPGAGAGQAMHFSNLYCCTLYEP